MGMDHDAVSIPDNWMAHAGVLACLVGVESSYSISNGHLGVLGLVVRCQRIPAPRFTSGIMLSSRILGCVAVPANYGYTWSTSNRRWRILLRTGLSASSVHVIFQDAAQRGGRSPT